MVFTLVLTSVSYIGLDIIVCKLCEMMSFEKERIYLEHASVYGRDVIY